MFQKIDDFAVKYLDTAKLGLAPIAEAVQEFDKFLLNLFYAFVALLVIVFTFPLWLLGKARSQQSTPASEHNSPAPQPLYQRPSVVANDFRLKVLTTAYEYETWLRENERGSSYSTFCDEFEYVGEDRRHVFQAVEAVRRCALAESV